MNGNLEKIADLGDLCGIVRYDPVSSFAFGGPGYSPEHIYSGGKLFHLNLGIPGKNESRAPHLGGAGPRPAAASQAAKLQPQRLPLAADARSIQ
jgi:hypothetical protein